MTVGMLKRLLGNTPDNYEITCGGDILNNDEGNEAWSIVEDLNIDHDYKQVNLFWQPTYVVNMKEK